MYSRSREGYPCTAGGTPGRILHVQQEVHQEGYPLKDSPGRVTPLKDSPVRVTHR